MWPSGLPPLGESWDWANTCHSRRRLTRKGTRGSFCWQTRQKGMLLAPQRLQSMQKLTSMAAVTPSRLHLTTSLFSPSSAAPSHADALPQTDGFIPVEAAHTTSSSSSNSRRLLAGRPQASPAASATRPRAARHATPLTSSSINLPFPTEGTVLQPNNDGSPASKPVALPSALTVFGAKYSSLRINLNGLVSLPKGKAPYDPWVAVYYAGVDTRSPDGGALTYRLSTNDTELAAAKQLLRISDDPDYMFVASWVDVG